MCDSHSMNGGKHNFYGVFDRIYTKTFPSVHPRMYLALELIGPPGDQRTLSLHFQNSSGDDVIPALSPIVVKLSDFGGCVILLDIQGLLLPSQGFYSFKVMENKALVGERVLYVEQSRG